MNIKEQHIVAGMTTDMNVSKFEPTKVLYARNVRITQVNNNQGLLCVTNEKGTKQCTFTGDSITGSIVGSTTINDYLVLFTVEELLQQGTTVHTDFIFRLEKTDGYDFLVRRLFSGNIGLSKEHPLETLSVYENETVQKVYWVDGVHQLRCINIADTSTRDVGNTTQFDANPTIELAHTLNITKYNFGGEFPVGTIQYAFTYHNQYGPETNIFEVSDLYELCPKTKGLAGDGRTSCSFNISITGTDQHFEYVRAYAIIRTSANASPAVRMLGDFSNESGSVSFVDNGSIGYSVDAQSLIFIGGEPVAPSTFATKDNVLFLGNIHLERPSIGSLIYEGTTTVAQKVAELRSAGTIPLTNVSQTIPGVGSGDWFYDYTMDNNRPSQSIRRFKYNENYRLGIIAQHETGIWSEVLWLGDYDNGIAPTFWSALETQQSSGIFQLAASSGVFTPILVRIAGAGYKRIAPVVVYPQGADRKVFCQGLVSATVYNVEDRYYNRPWVQASWFFRPISEGFGPAATPHASLYPANKKNIYGSENRNDKIMGGGEVQINTNPRNFTPEVSGYWQGQSQTYSRIPAADMVAMFGNDYYVDTSIVTLNSPDIELDDSIQQEDLDGLQFRIVGVAKSAFPNRRTEGYIDITANKSPGAKIISPAENRFLSVGTSYLVNPSVNFNGYLGVINDGQIPPLTGYISLILYPWHKTGRVYGVYEGEDEDLKEYAHLTNKVMSNITFAKTEIYSGASITNVPVEPVKLFDDTQNAFIPLGESADSPVYYGNIDSVRMFKKDTLSTANTGNANKTFYMKELRTIDQSAQLVNIERPAVTTSRYKVTCGFVLSLSSWGSTIIDDTLENALLKNGGERIHDDHMTADESVPIKYKSTRHAVIQLSHGQYEIPSLYRNDAAFTARGNSTVRPFWDENNQYTFSAGKVPFGSGVWQRIWTGVKDNYKNTLSCNIPTLYIGELYRTFDSSAAASRFGGNTEKAILGNVWTRCGNAVSISGVLSGATTLKFVEGDTYLARYDCLKTYPYADKDVNSIVEMFSTEVETRVNLDARYDNARGLLDNTLVNPTNYNLVNRLGYEQLNNFFTYSTQDYSRETIDHFPASVAITNEKVMGAQVDAWMQIPMTAVQDLDGVYGELKALKTFNNDVFAFQENAFGQILFNSRVQIPTSDGQPIEITNGMKFQGIRYLSNKIGCADKWTIGMSNSRMYWFDRGSRDIWSFGGQGLDNISTRLGVKGFVESWFRTPWIVGSPNLRTLHEETYNDMYFVFGNNTWDEKGALMYSESLDTFVSVLDYAGIQGIYSLFGNSYMLSETSVHQMWGGNYNSFFGLLKPYVLRFVANAQPTMHKVFDTVQWRSDTWNSAGKYLPNETFNKMRVWNQYQKSAEVSLVNTPGKPSPTKKKFNTFRALVPRDTEGNSLTTTDMRYKGISRIRGNYSVVELKHDTADTNKMQFYDLEIGEFL